MPGVTFFPLNDVPFLSLFLTLWLLSPRILYATWTSTALADLFLSKYRGTTGKVIWTFIVMFIPLIGSLIYHLFAAKELDVTINLTMIFGGIGILIIVFSISVSPFNFSK